MDADPDGIRSSGDGARARRIRERDRASTPLGPRAGRRRSLGLATRRARDGRHPMVIRWGPALVQLDDDARRDTTGPERHTAAPGGPGRRMPEQAAAPRGGGPGRALIERALPYRLGARATCAMPASERRPAQETVDA